MDFIAADGSLDLDKARKLGLTPLIHELTTDRRFEAGEEVVERVKLKLYNAQAGHPEGAWAIRGAARPHERRGADQGLRRHRPRSGLVEFLKEQPTEEQRPYQPFGAARALLLNKEPEIILAGPAGTGKSRAALEKLHLVATRYPGMRGLILRKTRKSLTSSALVIFEHKVLPARHPILSGPSRTHRSVYTYPNGKDGLAGSEIDVGGLDNPTKVMSAEYDSDLCPGGAGAYRRGVGGADHPAEEPRRPLSAVARGLQPRSPFALDRAAGQLGRPHLARESP